MLNFHFPTETKKFRWSNLTQIGHTICHVMTPNLNQKIYFRRLEMANGHTKRV